MTKSAEDAARDLAVEPQVVRVTRADQKAYEHTYSFVSDARKNELRKKNYAYGLCKSIAFLNEPIPFR